ncbi:YutD family protein [Apilactobacillus xinyiensis]|uniref:YutD family protein n=1 Tax=Apilactobacillus xinyiensis TaxID=2841032 RepID=UPI00200E28D0|nr:YutD family protein [Apilactobacillus xinyiensis]MCL0329996.1 YutD family protein [Apilactobacillus xinyiensis]
MDRKKMDELVDERKNSRRTLAKIEQVDGETVLINNHTYKIICNKNNSFNIDDFKDRYNPIFSKYDFIVGDYGYDSLRLKGFYIDGKRVPKAIQYSSIDDYLLEYCNLGALYFVLNNLEVKNQGPEYESNNKRRTGNKKRRSHKFVEKKISSKRRSVKKSNKQKLVAKSKNNKHPFKIMQNNK